MRKIFETIASIKAAAVLAALLAAAMMAATLFNQDTADKYFYQSPWFNVMVALFTANLIICTVLHALRGRRLAGFLAIHGGILLVIAGGAVTALYAENGYIFLRPGESAEEYGEEIHVCGMCGGCGLIIRRGGEDIYDCPACKGAGAKNIGSSKPLGFSITLDKFEVRTRSGGKAIEAFQSDVKITSNGGARKESILVNHPASESGFRIFQSGYDKFRGAWTVLHIRRDPGKIPVFAGFAAVAFGLIAFALFYPVIARRRGNGR